MTIGTSRYFAPLLLLALSGPQAAILHAQQPAQETEVQQFQHLEDNWSIAYVKKDQYAMELLLAPSFVNISAAGTVSTRNQMVSEMFDHTAGDVQSMEQRVVNVRVLGDLVLVQGTYIIHYRTGSHTVDERGIFTHVYQKARTSWICVNAQRTAVFDQADEKQKSSGKRSGAALPFHVPLVYKGAPAKAPDTPQPGSPQAPVTDKQPQ